MEKVLWQITSSCTALSITDNIDAVDAKYFQISPNPSNGLLMIKSDKWIETISISTPTGEFMETIIIESTVIKNLDLSTYPAGMYFIHLKVNDIVQTQKIILQK